MSQVDPDALGGQELAAVFLAATLAEARRAEVVLTDRGVTYAVKTEQFGHSLLGSPRVGAVFYVQASQADYCGSQLVAAGLGRGVLVG
jgi:hypothetical protein